MLKFEDYVIPSASMGKSNPMPDIKNIGYIHSGYKTTEAISEEEAKYLGKGMISTMLPYTQQDGYDRVKKDRAFRAAILENKYVRAVFLPELGGRLWSLFDKEKNRELLYKNPVFQPGNLALRNAWFSGGVEFNIGIRGHNPLTCSPMWCAADKTKQGDVLRLYEYERIRGVAYCVSAYLPDNSKSLYINVRIENKSAEEKYMYWWSNIAFPETRDTRVLVPADKAFVCSYNEGHYLLDKTSIPVSDGADVTYPVNTKRSRDFFYDIPRDSRKWVAAIDKDGKGLLQCSTDKLISRKLFVWGQGRGGRRWNEWLSEEGSNYIEIQAGLAHTQLEHIPMPANTVWEWTEAYTALDGDADVLHGDFANATKAVENYMLDRVGDSNKLTFPLLDDVIESKIVYNGSGWGELEEKISGKKLSDNLTFREVSDGETKIWHQLLDENTFPAPDVQCEPHSFIVGDKWLKKLENLPEQNWYSLLHIGVVRYAKGDIDGARIAWEDSIEFAPSPWAYRNLAMLYKNEFGDMEKGKEYILKAFELKKDCIALNLETASILTGNGDDELWIKLYETLPENVKMHDRTRFFTAIALVNLEMYDEAAKIINDKFIMNDLKEGEISVSKLWFDLYRRIYAKEIGVKFDKLTEDMIKAADQKYPLPYALDFRMQ